MLPVLRLAVLVCCGSAYLLAASPSWLRIKSPNFELFTTAGERDGRDLIRRFEQVRTFFVQALGTGVAGARPIRIVAFRSDKEYEPYKPNEIAVAFYHPGFTRDYIVMKRAASEYYPVAVHEYTHLLVEASQMTTPLWMDEGLAELYSTMEALGSQIVVGKPPLGVGQTLAREKWIELGTVLAADHDSPLYNEKARAGMFYAESWALTHMLFMSESYRPRTKALLSALNAGAEAGVAFQGAYGKPLERVQSDLRAYVRSGLLQASVFDLKWDKASDALDVSDGAFGARLALAEIVSESRGKLDQAVRTYEQLAREYPERWEVQEAWAEALFRQTKNEEAAQRFKRATELGCDDARAFLQYGRVLMLLRRESDAVTALKNAVKLNPASGETHRELGVALVRAGEYRDGLAQLLQAGRVDPRNASQFFYTAAFAYYRIGEPASARESLAKAEQFATGVEKAAIADLRAALERTAASIAAIKPVPRVSRQDDSSGEAPPRLRRPVVVEETAEVEAAVEKLPIAEGALEEVRCRGETARLRIAVKGKSVMLDILEPENVVIRSGSGAKVDLTCGLQQSRRIRVEYETVSPPAPGSAGVVRSIEFL